MTMEGTTTRRQMLGTLGRLAAGLAAIFVTRPVKATVQKMVSTSAPKEYDPTKHRWRMVVDIEKCIGCGLCVEACKKENHVPKEAAYFRTWIERYIIRRPKPGSNELRGETEVDSPNGGIKGFPPSPIPKEDILKSFFVPKLCNQCEGSPCVQCCPVGASFDSPDGVVLVDPSYCIGCGFCVQSCPYGCRFMNPITKTAEKCTFCYHRITRGLKPACVEVCPTGARLFGDVKDPASSQALQVFVENHKVQVLKPHLGTRPQLLYAGLDTEVR
jgi:Fe-S-cluster-containing dehydrogenase component